METFLMIVCAIVVWLIYHQIFTVAYFDLRKGCLLEIMACLAIGYWLAQLVMKSWWIILLLIVIGIVCLSKSK